MEPNFVEIYESYEVYMIQDAYDTVKRLELWDWLKEFKPHPNEGFMFTPDITIATIGKEMKYDGHSGASFGWTMREIQSIARNGWETHKELILNKRGAACPCRRERGKLTGWCGVAGGGVPACDH